MKRWVALSLCVAMLAGITGCVQASSAGVRNLMENITPAAPANDRLSDTDASLLTAAAVRLLQNSGPSDNLLLSPLSVLCAVGMTANGANSDTKKQFETFFGMDTEAFCRNMCAWLRAQEHRDGLLSANSVWFQDNGFEPKKDFLQANADYYSADVYQGAFDQDTVNEINRWVSAHTDGMIPEILKQLPDDAVMYLISALCLRCRWAREYTEQQVHDGCFTTQSGQKNTVQMMSSNEYISLQDGDAVGFMKPYEGGSYAFAALLPPEGVDLQDYIASLDGERLFSVLKNAKSELVSVSMPKFHTEYDAELSDVFRSMGVTAAFDPNTADLTGIGIATDNLFISRILHKTCITVNETGTEAAAATAVEIFTRSAAPVTPKSVFLDRPFIYMIVDLETNIPVLIGTVTNIQK